MIKPYFDDLVLLKDDIVGYQVYKHMPFAQRLAFGDLGIQFEYKIKRFTKPQASTSLTNSWHSMSDL